MNDLYTLNTKMQKASDKLITELILLPINDLRFEKRLESLESCIYDLKNMMEFVGSKEYSEYTNGTIRGAFNDLLDEFINQISEGVEPPESLNRKLYSIQGLITNSVKYFN